MNPNHHTILDNIDTMIQNQRLGRVTHEIFGAGKGNKNGMGMNISSKKRKWEEIFSSHLILRFLGRISSEDE